MTETKVNGEDAIKRAYLSMKKKVTEPVAFETAVQVARFHHPKLSKTESIDLTATILDHWYESLARYLSGEA